MFVTPNMGLTAWDQGSDQYDHSQLASNFVEIDDHNHTLGKGRQIPSAGIQNSAITSDKLASDAVVPTIHIAVDSIPQSRLGVDSVGSPELQSASVGTGEIQDHSVTQNKLDPSILPIGFVAMWYRADAAVLPPAGWEVMDGRAWSSIPNSLGAGGLQWNAGNIPNMVNKFPLGAALAGTGSTPDLPPNVGATGGAHARNLSHTHTTNPHTHAVDSHAHAIAADGAHYHRFIGTSHLGVNVNNLHSRDVGVPRAEGTRQALYMPNHNIFGELGSDVDLPMETVDPHSHGGATGSSSAGTNSVTISVNNSLVSDLDLRPAYVGLIYIMKVN